jgi:hypothetical protein
MIDTYFNSICVFCYDGTLIKSWKTFEIKPGKFSYLCEITIYQGVIFVNDSRNRRIQAFTRNGRFILKKKM